MFEEKTALVEIRKGENYVTNNYYLYKFIKNNKT